MNKEKLKGYWEKVKTALSKVPIKIWILIAAIVAVIVIGVVVFLATRPYSPLISGATEEETATVLTWLQEQGVTDYRMQGSGTIMVPEGQVTALKARLLQEQYSANNSSYNGYFEMVSALSTSADRSEAKLITLQNVMNATISKFDGVRAADVNINPGEDNGYVLDANSRVNASAGVLLTMENGKLLTDGQANAIRNYISHGVPNLSVENVDVRDSIGNTYSDFSGGGNAQSDSMLKLQLEQEWNNRLRTQIVEMLAKGCGGEENVAVTVNSTVELGNKTVNRHEVELPKFAQDGETGGRGILGSEFYAYTFNTPDQGSTGGIVGTTTNADLPTYVEPGEAQAELERILQEEANRIYDNTTTDTEMIIHCGTLTDVSASVWINGTVAPVDVDKMRLQIAAATNIPPTLVDEETGEEYDNWKLSVINDPFAENEPPVEPEPDKPGTLLGLPYWVFIAAGAGLLLFIILLVVILLLRRKKRKKQEAEQKAMEELLATAMPGQSVEIGEDGQPIIVETPVQLDEEGNPVSGANVMDLHTERSMELRQNIRDYVDENMEVAALLLKSWMKEDGDNG